MAAPFFSTPFQPYVYQSPQEAVTPFQILGGEAQIVQIMLRSQEKVTAKPGTMCYMSGFIHMENIYFPENEGGMWQWLFGKSVSSIVLFNTGPNDGFVGIAAPSPGRILPVDLANFGGEILCQPDAFLCSISDVTVANTVDQRARNVVAGAEVILKQKLVGQGLVFLVAGGSGKAGKFSFIHSQSILTDELKVLQAPKAGYYRKFERVVQKTLDVEEILVVDAACVVAMTSTINFQAKYSNPMRRVVFGNDNQLTATLTGPGIVFLQSLPFHRLSQRIARAVTSPSMRENPKFFIQIVIFFFLAYVMIVSSLILTDV